MNDQEILEYLKKEHCELLEDLKRLFKTNEIVLKWIKKPKPVLVNQSPLMLLQDEPHKVEDLVNRIKTGDIS